MSLKNKLQRYKTHISSSINETTKNKTHDCINESSIPFAKDWEAMQVKPFPFEDQYCYVREVNYPLSYKHGLYELKEILHAVNAWKEAGLNHPLSAKEYNATDLIFFDTETTGLGSGAGHVIFLLGVAVIKDNHLQIKQYFLPGPGSEVAFYKRFLEDVTNLKSLVTYNGRAFDWPKVKTRHTMIKKAVPSLPSFGHFDLLHGSRRLWKESLPSVKLSVVESEILGIKRESDTPGYMAPILYFDYLKTKDPKPLIGVFQHNEIDILSLVTLYTHISYLVLNESVDPSDNKEAFKVAKWLENTGEQEEAVARYHQLIQNESSKSKSALKALAFHFKKEKQYDKAISFFLDYLNESNIKDVEVYLELAKLYEHKVKDFSAAHHYSQLAYSTWKEQKRIFKAKEQLEEKMFIKRLERIKRKERK